MKTTLLLLATIMTSLFSTPAAGSLYDIPLKDIDGKDTSLKPYAGKVLLLVNVASKCGFTPQYTALEATFQKYQAQGLVVCGFPCNQFGAQEPGGAAEIGAFCQKNYEVSFPLFARIDVNGPRAHPLYRFLKKSRPGILGTLMPSAARSFWRALSRRLPFRLGMRAARALRTCPRA